ncbi:hypothetical protein Pdw03_2186 [Penicillium digitatum]|uniref:Uncharacterized protein n=1 Tax=Penicillium digitatum TaxID=36651 RepID=A0A7T6XTS8_PENDI|nr:hypothetical protein Pdw03_2186 [Penicillium digitatum]
MKPFTNHQSQSIGAPLERTQRDSTPLLSDWVKKPKSFFFKFHQPEFSPTTIFKGFIPGIWASGNGHQQSSSQQSSESSNPSLHDSSVKMSPRGYLTTGLRHLEWGHPA